ncbi:hypothetical protein FGG08_001444 [Glutinoglossum americanum]|uniref:Sugar phosphate phosphatase n=1 Tax=Glutinoglossum americanum TaxID=1670608 RepID=A0A9P8IES9_9PEZI|nr:hypothetical protein FGG08_001444 [Glutinoglossum americanum]
MEYETKTAPYKTSDRTSFAYVTARDRWPVILTGAIDDIHRASLASNDPEHSTEGKRIVESLAKLKYEIQHDRKLTPIPDDGEQDIAGYNSELEALGLPTWFNVPWLYAECYLYRRINTFFSLSNTWKNYDVFGRQKLSTFKSSRPAVLELAARYKELVLQLESESSSADTSRSQEDVEEAKKLLFIEMCEICLWGNATDLSLLTSLTYEDLQKLQGSEARKNSEKNILVNDLPIAYQILKDAQTSRQGADRAVDVVLDNAGFELFVDLILAGYLLSSDLATTIVLYPKSIPWFVSDVIPSDFAHLLSALADPQLFYSTPSEEDILANRTPPPLSDKEVDNLAFLFERLRDFHVDGKLVIRGNRFWTQPGSYWRLPGTQQALMEDLRQSELVILKGDLNYRKLTGDAMWPPTTPFQTAIGPLGPGSGVRTLALRTCKADVVVGLPEGVDERLRVEDPDGGGDSGMRKWAMNGKWAVVQFCDGKE